MSEASTNTLYAMYRGDTFIDVGTRWELADRHRLKPDSIVQLAAISSHKKVTTKTYPTRLLAYRLDRDYEQ